MANFDTLNVVFGLLKMHVKNKFKEKVMGFIFSMCRELFFLFIFRISYFSRCSYVSLKKEPIIRVWVYNLWPVPSVGATSARGAPAAPLWRGYSQAPVCSNTRRTTEETMISPIHNSMLKKNWLWLGAIMISLFRLRRSLNFSFSLLV